MNFRFIKVVIMQVFMFIKLIPTYKRFKNNRNNVSQEEIYEVVRNHTKNTLKSMGVEFSVKGYENLPKDENVLFIANHSNWVDGLILPAIVDRPTGMIIAKEANWEKFKFIDNWLKLINCVYMDRKNTREGLKAIQEATNILENTSSIGVFPEGLVTRSDKLLEFKDGAFRMAIKSKVPVVPVVIRNSKEIYEPIGRWYGKINKAYVEVEILPCIKNHINNPNMKTKELSNIAHSILESNLQGYELKECV